jgi:soluble lytic murein transglycosylase-like protein
MTMKTAAFFLLFAVLPAAASQDEPSSGSDAQAGPSANMVDPRLTQGREDILWGIQGVKGFLPDKSELAKKYTPALRELWQAALKAKTFEEVAPAMERMTEIKKLLFAELHPDYEGMSEEQLVSSVDAFKEKMKIFVSLQRTQVKLAPAQQRQLDKVKKLVLSTEDPAALAALYDRLKAYGPGDSPALAPKALGEFAGAAEQVLENARSAPSAQLPRGLSAHGSSSIPAPGSARLAALEEASQMPLGTASEEQVVAIARRMGLSAKIVRMVLQESKRQGVDYRLVLAVIKQESAFNPNATSGVGARGLMQIMPATGRGLGVRNANDLYNPLVNIRAGIKYLRELWNRFTDFSWSQLASFNPFNVKQVKMAVAAYNAGPGAVSRYGNVPPYRETRDYVAKVLRNYVDFRRSLPSI